MTITHSVPLRTLLPMLTGMLVIGSVFASGARAASAHRPAQASIKSVVLTTSDVSRIYGGGFRAFIDGVITNKDLASAEKTAGATSGPNMATAGRVTGYDSVWFRGGRTSYLSVTNGVSEYRSSSFPQAAFAQFGRYKSARTGMTIHLSSISGIGDEAAVLTIKRGGVTGQGIIFRRGHYLVNLMAGSQHGKISLSSVSKLAAIEDQRIQARG